MFNEVIIRLVKHRTIFEYLNSLQNIAGFRQSMLRLGDSRSFIFDHRATYGMPVLILSDMKDQLIVKRIYYFTNVLVKLCQLQGSDSIAFDDM